MTLIAGVGTSLTLTQAWVPSLALFWNPPAWALSATVAFYFAYPGAITFLRPASARILFILLIILSLLSLVPPLLYLVFDPERNALSATATTIGGNWLAALRFHPIVWLSSFLSGIVLARLLDCSKIACRPSDLVGRLALQGRASLDGERFPIDLAGVGIRSGSTLKISVGDLAILLGVVMLALPLPIPYVLLRHGLFLPIHLVVVWELAHGRGFASRLLSASLLRQWSKASFGLFALQMPVGVWFAYLVIRRRNGSVFELLAMILATLTASYYISQVIDRHVTRPLREKINSATDGPRSNSPSSQRSARRS